jgi:hypothetical protein
MVKDSLARVRRLQQTDETWECSVQRMRSWITPRDQAPYRPYIVMVVSSSGAVVGSNVVEGVPTPDQVLEGIVKAMHRPVPGSGRKRRPAIIYVDNEAAVQVLVPSLAEIGVNCEYRRTLPKVAEALVSMEQFMAQREPIPGLLKSPGVTPFLVNGLFEAAASFYREAPWQWIDDSRPIEVRYPPDRKPRYAVVMGHGGETYGLAVYDSPDDLQALYAGTPPEKLMGQQEWMSLLFVEEIEMPFDDLDDIERYGWPVAGELAYPFPVRITRAEQFVRSSKSELLWFEAALLAIPTFVRDYMQAKDTFVHPAEAMLTVTMADGKDSIHLRYPLPGFEIPFEQDWAAIEDEEQVQAQTAQERNAELLRTFEQWLTKQGLSKKAIQRHMDDVTFFADAYMVGVGGCVICSRPADQADSGDVDEFMTEWFMHEAKLVSEDTVEASVASLTQFYTCLKDTGHMKAREADAILELLQEEQDYYVEIARDHAEGGF